MAKFNIEKFLQEHNISYITDGSEVSKGNININCPFCSSDSKYHLGINLDNNWFGCWRDTTHRGKDISRLVAALLKCSRKYAKHLVYGSTQVTIDSEIDLRTAIRNKLFKTTHNTPKDNERRQAANLSEFKAFKNILPKSIYYRYLEKRGFDNVSLLIDKYQLKFAPSGNWMGRIIFPVYIDKKLMTWQGRDVTGKAYLRYKDLSKDKSVKYLKSCLYNYDNLSGDVLYICEGVFDALKIDYFTPSYVTSTCVFTKTVTDAQYKLLFKKIRNFEEIRILFDQGTIKDAQIVKGQLKTFHPRVKVVYLPDGIKDAGDMTRDEIRSVLI